MQLINTSQPKECINDKWVWKHDNSAVYYVKFVYAFLQQPYDHDGTPFFFHCFWKINITSNSATFRWKLSLDKIQTTKIIE